MAARCRRKPHGTGEFVGAVAGIGTGTSTNPARTFGPALISGRWDGWWLYWLGPMAGMLVAVLVFSSFAKRIEVAKLYHFESDRRRLFHRMAR